MPAVGGETVIRARDEYIVIQTGGSAENEARIVQTVSGRKIIGYRLTRAEGLIEISRVTNEVEHCGINPNATRVEVLEVVRCKSDKVAAPVQISKDALAEGGRGDNALGALLLPLACSLVIGKEKQAVLVQRSTDRRAEDIAVQPQRLIGSANVQLRLFYEVVVGAGNGVAQVLIRRTVENVRATLGDQDHLRARALSLIRSVVGGSYAKLLNRVLGHRKYRGKRISVGLVVHVHAIE